MVGWSSEEDELLRRAVAIHGEADHWKTIALVVPGRSNKACRKRWLHSLSPSVKKSAWTGAEDRKLLELYNICGSKWSQIARQIPGRTDDACSKRYREALDPTLKKDEWTPEEDERLRQAHVRLGGRWGHIGQELNRSGLGCRNRWRLLERRSSKSQSNVAPELSVYDPCALPLPEDPTNEFLPYFTSTSYIAPHTTTIRCNLTNDVHDSPFDSQPILAPTQYSSFSSLSHALGPSDLSPESSSSSELSEPDLFPNSSESAHFMPLVFESFPNDDDDNYSSRSAFNGGNFSWPELTEPASSFCISAFSAPWDTVVTDSGYNSPSTVPSLTPITPQLLVPSLSENNGIETNSPKRLLLFGPSSPSSPSISLCNTGPEQTHTFPCENGPNQDHPTAPVSVLGELPVQIIVNSRQPCEITTLPCVSLAPEPLSTNTHITRSQTNRRKSNSLRKPSNSSGFCRLSSQLTVTSDPSVLPYACGHTMCWPHGMPTGQSCFATSKELSEHVKAEHPQDNVCQRPFKCALEGCGKDWKSVNGLQYHLQISAAHFRIAVNEKLSETQPPTEETELASETECTISSPVKSKSKFFACSRPGCAKVYRQISGLRYHEQHGHPEDIPAQLKDMPPILAKRVANKSTSGRKRRRQSSVSHSLGHKIPRT